MSGFSDAFDEIVSAKGKVGEPERLRMLFDLAWLHTMTEHPEWATLVGFPGQNGRWTDASADAIERRRGEDRKVVEVLDTFDPEGFGISDRLNHDLFRRSADLSIEGARFPAEYLPLGPMGGPHSSAADTIQLMPLVSSSDLDDFLWRLRAFPTMLDQSTTLMREGVAKGITQPRVVLRDAPGLIENHIVDDPVKSPLLARLSSLSQEISDGDREALTKEARAIYLSAIRPSLEAFHGFVVEGYLPSCRDSIAIVDVPDGADWYSYLVRMHTTTPLSPKEVHELGQSEVTRILGEMEGVIRGSGFSGSFAEFSEFLRDDPRFYFDDAEDLLVAYRDICKRADPELARFFGKLPRLPYGVIPVPSYSEKTATTAYYQPGSPEAGRAGYFYANTYDLKARPKWEMEALALHEAVPGHHLQIALAQEMEGLPDFRRWGSWTAFIEGWGLYAESLGNEMGFYTDPYTRFGQLTYEMWRSIRLVVDTGMHALGWSRDQAIDFFRTHAAKTDHDIIVEVDRYISWPGQALAYKIGELKLKQLRARAASALGDGFDVRAFHDTVLEQGALPLDILEKRVDEWLGDRR